MALYGVITTVSRTSVRLLHPSNKNTVRLVRSLVCTETGALMEKPKHVPFGLVKVAITVFPFLMTGAMISKEVAALLEEHELFIPDDDDDD